MCQRVIKLDAFGRGYTCTAEATCEEKAKSVKNVLLTHVKRTLSLGLPHASMKQKHAATSVEGVNVITMPTEKHKKLFSIVKESRNPKSVA